MERERHQLRGRQLESAFFVDSLPFNRLYDRLRPLVISFPFDFVLPLGYSSRDSFSFGRHKTTCCSFFPYRQLSFYGFSHPFAAGLGTLFIKE